MMTRRGFRFLYALASTALILDVFLTVLLRSCGPERRRGPPLMIACVLMEESMTEKCKRKMARFQLVSVTFRQTFEDSIDVILNNIVLFRIQFEL